MYEVLRSKEADKALRRMPKNVALRIIGKIEALAVDPHAQNNNVKKLQGSPYFRLRVGDFRVIYEIQDERLVILLIAVRSRGGAYDDL